MAVQRARSSTVARLEAFGLFAVVLAAYFLSPVSVQSDSIWSIPTAISLLRQGNLDLDEYRPTADRQPHGTVEVGPHLYPWYPAAVSLVAVPVVALLEGVAWVGLRVLPHPPGVLRNWDAHFRAEGDVPLDVFAPLERLVAAACTTLAVIVFWAACRRRLAAAPALFLTAILAFGTGLWSTASRVLWQHGPSIAVLAVVVWLLTEPAPGRRWALALGISAGLAYVFRPTNSITAIGLLAYLTVVRPSALRGFVLGAGLVAVPFCASSLVVYRGLLPPYFRPEMLGGDHRHVLEALAGNLVSPARGLFVWTPVFVLALGGALVRLARGTLSAPETWMLVVIGIHWVAVSLLPQWWAGHSIGPRFFSDLSPYLCWLLVHPVEEGWNAWRSGRRGQLLALAGLALFGVFAHGSGATRLAVHDWNDGPPNVDLAPERVWDWRDVQYLRGLQGRSGG
ncbi:MAG: glycosyltransferase family 39 protein [Myxococcaceae bacterium]